MKPYPLNNIDYVPIIPVYRANNENNEQSRYIVYRLYDNTPEPAHEVRLTNSISKNTTYKGYYYTTTTNETLYEIAERYYGSEDYYWILAKANGLKDDKLLSLKPNITIIIPTLSELQVSGGYFSTAY